MATTDGSAIFEKRKFADNSKLSLVDTEHGYTNISQPEDFVANSETRNTLILFTLPSDGAITIGFTPGSAISNSTGNVCDICVSCNGAGGMFEFTRVSTLGISKSIASSFNHSRTFLGTKGTSIKLVYVNLGYLDGVFRPALSET